MEIEDFLKGNCFNAYEYFGAHPMNDGTMFRTYAPNAYKVCVSGDFNNWNLTEMTKHNNNGVFEVFIPGAYSEMKYLYRIFDLKGKMVEHCDPYGAGMEFRPNFASIIRNLNVYNFNDYDWMNSRNDCKNSALNIYEVHLGSWKKNGEYWYSYSEIADLLIPYMKDCGYNYLEIMPITEYPCDESWGYQATCYYSPTSRYGTAYDLMHMIDKFHQNGIGVILDFIPGHFAVDDYALKNYDGYPLYEYPNKKVAFNEWGSLNFNLAKGEVQSFIQSAANYWLEVFHFDGLRMDAVSNIIFWQGNKTYGENNRAVEFLKIMNKGLKKIHPNVIIAAEDSTDYPHVTKDVDKGGLGFDYKWDMGWMHDTLEYFQAVPYIRNKETGKISFSMWYFHSECFLLPFSHDEVVHGKATILQKMNGDYDYKFPQARALYMYMYVHPGKKLNFMGNEIGHFREWSEKQEQDWNLLDYEKHQEFHNYIKALNHTYLQYKELHYDFDHTNFKWADLNKTQRSIFAIRRRSEDGEILAVMHFDCDPKAEYSLPIEHYERVDMLICSNKVYYGGDIGEDEDIYYIKKDKKGKPILKIMMAPYDCLLFYIKYDQNKHNKKNKQ